MRHGVSTLLLWPAAAVAVAVGDIAVPWTMRTLRRAATAGPLRSLHAAVGRLPAAVALPLFLVPEVCSRLGWIASAWLLLQGDPWRAVAVYAASKLVAGTIALWVCSACMPALMQVRMFAAMHRTMMEATSALGRPFRRSPGRRRTRYAALVSVLRGRWCRVGR